MIYRVEWWNSKTGAWAIYGNAPTYEQCAGMLNLAVVYENSRPNSVDCQTVVELTAPDGVTIMLESAINTVGAGQLVSQGLPLVIFPPGLLGAWKAHIWVLQSFPGWVGHYDVLDEKDMTVVGSGGGLTSDKTMWYIMGGAAAILFIMWVRSNG